MSSTGPVPSSTNDTAPTCRPIIFFPAGAAESSIGGATVAASATAVDLTKSRRVMAACIFISINACASNFSGNYFVIEKMEGAASRSSISPSPPSDGGEGRGEEVHLYWFPLSSVLSPLVPRGERMESLTQPWRKGRLASPCSRMLSELLCAG